MLFDALLERLRHARMATVVVIEDIHWSAAADQEPQLRAALTELES